jgi:hypothetical protein
MKSIFFLLTNYTANLFYFPNKGVTHWNRLDEIIELIISKYKTINMKKIIILQVILALLTSQLSAQTKNDYLLKSKRQKTAAWILLGGGVIIDFIGTYELISGFNEVRNGKHHHKIGTGLSLILASLPPIIGSIPLFTKSSKNKRMAMSMALSPQQMPALVQHITGNTFMPSVSLKISL